MMLYVRRDGRITEYIPFKFGFNITELEDGVLVINGRKAELNIAAYNAAADEAATASELRSLKQQKYNTVCVSYPQPRWFYELCDKIGIYVIDQANINSGYRKDDRNVGGAVANDPRFLPDFIDRVAYMRGRSKNYTSLIALSMGAKAATATTSTRLTSGLRGRIRCIRLPTVMCRVSGTVISHSPERGCTAFPERELRGQEESQECPPLMNIDLIVVGKTDSPQIEALLADYLKRLNYYAKVTLIVLPDPKNRKTVSAESQKRQEGEALLRRFGDGDGVVLLDERGEQMRSVDFSAWVQKRMNSGLKRLCFVIGGPYGFSKEVYARADAKISLSAMTFSHQMIRVLFAEQLYRAFTILNNEPYHHE